MSGLNFFGWQIGSSESDELPDIFPVLISRDDFIKTDIVTIYSKILTDVLERTNGLSDEQQSLLWDSCVKSEKAKGLITTIASAMADKKDLFLVYEKGINVLREASEDERRQIELDYKSKAESAAGVFISFKNYTRSDMIKIYSGLEYCNVGSLTKTMNLSKAIQFKMNDLRASTSLTDKDDVKRQAKAIAKGLGEGKDVLLDGKDSIETAAPDLTATKEAITLLNQKRSFYLGMPESYINGEQTGGIGTTGENDTKAIERGLKNYYFSIVKPVLKSIFKVDVTYKSQDFRQIDQGLEALKTFSLIDEALMSVEDQKKIIDQLFDFDTKQGSDR